MFQLFVGAGVGFACGAIGWALLCTRGDWQLNRLPVCEEGKCSSWEDYECLSQDGEGYFQCRCGHRYLMRKKCSRFLKIHADGSTEPYRKHGFWGYWRLNKSVM
jgi:hypothetical protein